MDRLTRMRAWDGESMRTVGILELFNDDTYRVNMNSPKLSSGLMPFIGIIDLNGKDVYEGDIVEVVNYLNGKEWEGHVHICVIKAVPGGWTFERGWIGESVQGSALRVIGNIYETPELL